MLIGNISSSPDITGEDTSIFESVKFIDDMKKNKVNMDDLRKQWEAAAEKFVKHKWIYRYTDEKQKAALEKHYANLTDDNVYYSVYKRSFNAICKFMGIPSNMVIIENMVFDLDKVDKEQWKVSVKYSKGLIKVQIPEGVQLLHVSPVENITALEPSFRSKVKGKYMYPTKRVFFTVAKEMRSTKAGLEGKKKTYLYTPKTPITTAYIDPTYSSFTFKSIYIETDSSIPVEPLERKVMGIKMDRKVDIRDDIWKLTHPDLAQHD